MHGSSLYVVSFVKSSKAVGVYSSREIKYIEQRMLRVNQGTRESMGSQQAHGERDSHGPRKQKLRMRIWKNSAQLQTGSPKPEEKPPLRE